MNNFEKTLASLKPEPVPAEWKNDLLDEAASAGPGEKVIRYPGGVQKKLIIPALAACWIAIGLLKITTPPDPGGTNLAERFGIPPEDLPLIAQVAFNR